MPIIQGLVNHDEIFARLQEPPIFINNQAHSSELERARVHEMVMSRYSTDMVSLLPSCRVGCTKGQGSFKKKCDICGTVVKSHVEADIEPSLWFKQPEGVEKLINPMVLMMLIKRFTRSNYSLIHWLIDPNYSPTVKVIPAVTRLKEQGFPQGYNNFVQNFDTIMEFLFNIKPFALPRGRTDWLKELIKQNRDCVFSQYLPLPNKSILIIKKSTSTTYIDPIVGQAANAILTMVSIDKDYQDQKPKFKENRTAKALLKHAEFLSEYISKYWAGKPGQFRKNMMGTRINFGFRAVISSVTNNHRHDDLLLPWGIGLAAWRHHLVAKLKTMGMSTNKAVGYIMSHIEKYDPLLDRLLQDMCDSSVRQCKFTGELRKGLAVCLQRNFQTMFANIYGFLR